MKKAPLTSLEIKGALKKLPGWKHSRKRLSKSYKFKDFKQAFRFMKSVAGVANRLDHHPEWKNVYNRVDVELTTHDLGNRVGPLDVRLAQAMETFSRQ